MRTFFNMHMRPCDISLTSHNARQLFNPHQTIVMSENLRLSNEQQLITLLRDEVKDVKDCYTKFSFQALAIIIAVFGAIFTFQSKEGSYIVFTAIPAIMVLLMVARIGI